MMNNYVVTFLITHNSHLWIMFSFNWLIIIWRGGFRLKLDVQGQGVGRISDVDGQGQGGLENWTIFMDVICVSSLKVLSETVMIFFQNFSKWKALNSYKRQLLAEWRSPLFKQSYSLSSICQLKKEIDISWPTLSSYIFINVTWSTEYIIFA